MLLRARGIQYIDISTFHAEYDRTCSKFLAHVSSIRDDLGEKLRLFATTAKLWWSFWLTLPTRAARQSVGEGGVQVDD